jgi:hypothetical protein
MTPSDILGWMVIGAIFGMISPRLGFALFILAAIAIIISLDPSEFDAEFGAGY